MGRNTRDILLALAGIAVGVSFILRILLRGGGKFLVSCLPNDESEPIPWYERANFTEAELNFLWYEVQENVMEPVPLKIVTDMLVQDGEKFFLKEILKKKDLPKDRWRFDQGIFSFDGKWYTIWTIEENKSAAMIRVSQEVAPNEYAVLTRYYILRSESDSWSLVLPSKERFTDTEWCTSPLPIDKKNIPPGIQEFHQERCLPIVHNTASSLILKDSTRFWVLKKAEWVEEE